VALGHGVWRSLVARFVRDEEVVGSNPATPTKRSRGTAEPVPRHSTSRTPTGRSPYRGASEPNRCRRRLLETTSTEDSDIAAAAMSGLSSPIAARGIAARLYPNAQPRLVLIVRSVARESAIASGIANR